MVLFKNIILLSVVSSNNIYIGIIKYKSDGKNNLEQ